MNSAGVDIQKVLTIIRPNAKWRMGGEEYEGLVWIADGQGGGKPTYQEIQTAWQPLSGKEAEGKVQRANIPTIYNAMFNGTGTVAERAVRLEKTICWIVRHHMGLVD